jgi:hypothetical protein
MIEFSKEQQSILKSVEKDHFIPYGATHHDVCFLVEHNVIREDNEGNWHLVKTEDDNTLPKTLEEAISLAKIEETALKNAEFLTLTRKRKAWYDEALASFKLPFTDHILSLIKPEYEMHIYEEASEKQSAVGVKAVFCFKEIVFEICQDCDRLSRGTEKWLLSAYVSNQRQVDSRTLQQVHPEDRDRELLLFIDNCLEKVYSKPIVIDFGNSAIERV